MRPGARSTQRRLSYRNPSDVVENLRATGSLTTARKLNLTAPQDGHTVATIFNPRPVTQSFLEPNKVHLHFHDYAWIGAISAYAFEKTMKDATLFVSAGPKEARGILAKLIIVPTGARNRGENTLYE